MPMFNLNSDAVEETLIEFTAGESGTLGLYIRGEDNATVDLHKSETAVLYWHPDRADEEEVMEGDDE